MSYKVELSNGKVFSGLGINGTCFVSKAEVKAVDFAGGMKLVKVSGRYEPETGESGGYEVSYEWEYPKLGGVEKIGSEWYFWFEEVSEESRAVEKAAADVEYLAMMTGVEL